jgi:hypothetical protein
MRLSETVSIIALYSIGGFTRLANARAVERPNALATLEKGVEARHSSCLCSLPLYQSDILTDNSI